MEVILHIVRKALYPENKYTSFTKMSVSKGLENFDYLAKFSMDFQIMQVSSYGQILGTFQLATYENKLFGKNHL